ncbi:MAG: O-antigen ligase family protein [Bacteroidota bacterium]|nr:O-antigen ligase family protein [Bacteroidota bacterium]
MVLLLLLLPFSLYQLFVQKSIYWKVICSINLYYIHFILILSCTRSIYLSLALFYILFCFCIYKYRLIRSIRLYRYIFLLFIVFISLVPFYRDITTTLGMNKTKSQQLSTLARYDLWDSAISIFAKYPISGIGSNNFGVVNNEFRSKSELKKYSPLVTNTYFQILVEKGFLGILELVVFLGTFLFAYNKWSTFTNSKSKLNMAIFLCAIISVLFKEVFFSTLLFEKICGVFFCVGVYTIFCNVNFKMKLYPLNNFIVFCFLFVNSSLLAMNFFEFKYSTLYKKFVSGNILGTLKIELPSINYFDLTKDALYTSFLGLNKVNKVTLSTDSIFFSEYCLTKSDSLLLYQGIKYYSRAVEFNPYDDLFYHNLGMIFLINKQDSLALKCVDKALKLSPDNSIYLISKAIFEEKINKDSILSAKLIASAICLDPEIIVSDFWIKYINNNKIKERLILDISLEKLLNLNSKLKHPIISARLGAYYFFIKEHLLSKKTLIEVNNIMPSFPRVNYYLGKIYAYELNSDSAFYFYKRSFRLGRNDYINTKEIANIYFENKNFPQAEKYYLTYLVQYLTQRSFHSTGTGQMYLKDLVVFNDIFPNDYIYLTKTPFDNNVLIKLIICCKKTNHVELYNYLKSKSSLSEISLSYISSSFKP